MADGNIRLGTVDFPQEFINACNRKLIVFAGAGVSMGAPSNLPNFEKLALEVGKGTAQENNEPLDRYLGRVRRQGGNIHNLIKQQLDRMDSKPNPLHKALLGLFKSADHLRLVTTNQDRHFTTELKLVFSEPIEHFYAPALPLGDNFKGVVYLHGSIDRELLRMVFTDEDFSRAYITEGWAARFLTKMFETYTVLFVGYSHEDPVMTYLARGLDPNKASQRYALISDDENSKDWEYLGIQPLVYEKSGGEDPHCRLLEAINMLGELVRSDSLTWERQIMDIVAMPPSTASQERQDFVAYVMNKPEGAQYFARHAKSLEWFKWTEEKGVLQNLFTPSDIYNKVDEIVARWFVENFICTHADAAFSVVARQFQRLNAVLWWTIAAHLHSNLMPEESILKKWVDILLASIQPHWSRHSLNYILIKCRHPENRASILTLFEFLTRPQIHIVPSPKRSWVEDAVPSKPSVEPKFAGERYYLKDAWKKMIKPHLDEYSYEIMNIVTAQITLVNQQMRNWGMAGDGFDLLSRDRAAIEPHAQNQVEDVHDFLIDVARDTLDWLSQNRPEQGDGYIAKWNDSQSEVLKRLALYGVGHCSVKSPDEKLQWIITNDFIGKYGFKHEVFKLLDEHYSEASEQARGKLLSDAQGKEEECDLLYWLKQKFSACQLVNQRFGEACKDYKPKAYPDLYSWSFSIGGVVHPKSPLSKDELFAMDPCQKADYFINFNPSDIFKPTRDGLLPMIAAVVSENYEWGMKLAECLKQKSEWNTDTWDSILQGWRNGTWSESQWQMIVAFLNESIQLYGFKHSIADLMKAVVSREHEKLPFSCLPAAEKLAFKIWDCWEGDQTQQITATDGDWAFKAINNPGGKMAEVGVYALSYKRITAGENWTGFFPDESRNYFEKILSCQSNEAVLGRVMLARYLNFIYSYSQTWTEEKIIPMLDWEKDKIRARQIWHGYLSGGLADERLWGQLFSKYKSACVFMQDEDKEIQNVFSNHIAIIIGVMGLAHTDAKSIFDEFCVKANVYMRERWAWHFSKTIPAEPEKIKLLWNTWLSNYWNDRNNGRPTQLSEAEKEQMVRWVIALEPVFEEVVDRICAADAPRMEYPGDFYADLLNAQLAQKQPIALAKMVCHLLKKASQPFLVCDQIEKLIKALIQNSAPENLLRCICNELNRLGCPDAQKISGEINGQSI